MEKKAIRRVVSLGVLLALLISVLPLLQLNIGQAEAASPISVRINSLAQVDGSNLSDAITKSNLGASHISSIDVVSGVLTGADISSIADMSALKEITIRTLQPPPTIGDVTIFASAPAARSIKVLSSVVEQYKNANDGGVGDNSWYGFNIISVDDATMNPNGNTPTSENNISEIKLDGFAPVTGETPKSPTKTSSFGKYNVTNVLWSTTDNKAVTRFEDDKDYKLLVELKAETGFQFTAGATLVLADKSHYSPSQKALNAQIETPTLATTTTTNDTLRYTIKYTKNAVVSSPKPRAAAGVLEVSLASPVISTIPELATLPVGMAAHSTTVWHDMGGNGIGSFPPAFSDSDSYTVFLNVTANTIGDPMFNGYTNVIINDTAPQPPQFKCEVKNFVVSTNKDGISIELKYTRNKIIITDSNAKISLTSPIGGEKAAPATSDNPSQFEVTSTQWFDTTAIPVEIPQDQLFPYEGKYEARIVLTAKEPYQFNLNPQTIITATSNNGAPQHIQQPAKVDSISADGKTATVTVTYLKNAGTCTHSSLIVTGPRVPIPPFESGLTTNAIEAKIGESAELVISKVSCGACHVDITSEALFSWRRVNREVPGSPYEALTVREKGKNIYKIETVSSVDDVYDYYANVTLNASLDGQNSDYVYLKIGDITMPDPYFKPTTVTGDLGIDLVLRVLSGLADPQPTRMKYEWRKGQTPVTGNPTGEVIYTAYNDASFHIRSLKSTDEGYYTVTVTNEVNGKFKSASVLVKTRVSPNDLIPINQKDIYALDFKAPVTGEVPTMLKVPADANYTIEHKWRNSTSIVAPPTKFESGKTYIADVIIRPKTGYRMGEVGAGSLEIDVVNNYLTKTFKEMGPDGTYCRLEVKFNKTTNPNKKDQAKLSYVTTLPEKKTYGDTDFVVAVTGGSGNGDITFTSSDPKVLRVESVSNGSAVISVVGGGEATITATKAAGSDEENSYNQATVASSAVTVKPKVLVVKAVDKTIKAGTTTEVFPVDISGFVRGDSQFNLKDFVAPTAKATIPTLPAETETTKKSTKKGETDTKTPEQIAAEEQAKLDKLCGEYEIIASGGTPTPAYVFRYVTGVLTVNKTGVQQSPPPNQNYLKSDSYQIEDRENGIRLFDVEQGGYFVAGTELKVENITYQLTPEEKALYNANVNAAMNGKELAQVYDISLKLDGSPIQPKGDVLVDIAVTNSLKGRFSDLQMVYISDYGDVTVMPHSLSAQNISFLTDHFSKYAIIGVARTGSSAAPGSGTDVPQTSDISLTVLWSAMLLAVISGITFYQVKKIPSIK